MFCKIELTSVKGKISYFLLSYTALFALSLNARSSIGGIAVSVESIVLASGFLNCDKTILQEFMIKARFDFPLSSLKRKRNLSFIQSQSKKHKQVRISYM